MAKHKGVKYIAQKLVKYYKKYPRYTDALPEARRVLAQIEDVKEKVTIKNIFDKTRVHRKKGKKKIVQKKEKGIPQLPPEMKEEMDYFMLEDYIKYIADTPKSIYLKSKTFPSSLKQPIQGGGNYSYDELFADFVSFFNTIQKNSVEEADGRYVPDLYLATVTTTDPVKNKKGKWVAEIIYTSAIDYGWDAANAKAPPKEGVVSGPIVEKPEKEVVTPEVPVAPIAATDDKEFLLQIEKEKQKTAVAETAKIEKKMEYIKQLKELGFTAEEIKAELKKI